jgi:hypothetical protein
VKKIWLWFLARFHLNDQAVCLMSRGKSKSADYHDYQDSKEGVPLHFHDCECVRCGKTFVI